MPLLMLFKISLAILEAVPHKDNELGINRDPYNPFEHKSFLFYISAVLYLYRLKNNSKCRTFYVLC